MINPRAPCDTAEAMRAIQGRTLCRRGRRLRDAPHIGRGGWTWYTGSAGWMYRLITESLLGLRRRGDVLEFAPLLPQAWPGFSVCYCHGDSFYRIAVSRSNDGRADGVRVILDGILQRANTVHLVDDGETHHVEVAVPGTSADADSGHLDQAPLRAP